MKCVLRGGPEDGKVIDRKPGYTVLAKSLKSLIKTTNSLAGRPLTITRQRSKASDILVKRKGRPK